MMGQLVPFFLREVDYDGVVGPFFSEIADKKDIDDDRYNPVSMRGQVNVEVEDQSGNFVTLSN